MGGELQLRNAAPRSVTDWGFCRRLSQSPGGKRREGNYRSGAWSRDMPTGPLISGVWFSILQLKDLRKFMTVECRTDRIGPRCPDYMLGCLCSDSLKQTSVFRCCHMLSPPPGTCRSEKSKKPQEVLGVAKIRELTA